MMKPLIITCAITGAEVDKKKQPNLPITPKEQAKAAKDALKAGASIIHLHVRDEAGVPTQCIERFEEVISMIRYKTPDALIQISTGGAIGESVSSRIVPLELKPEMASLNMGTMNFGNDVFQNSYPDIVRIAKRILDLDIVPELEIYDAGMLETAYKLLQEGLISQPFRVQFVLGVPGGMNGDLKNLMFLKSRSEELFGKDLHWSVAGIGRYQLPVAIHAMLLGGHVRVGFEDNIYYKQGELAKSNAQLVERVVRIAKEIGRPIASAKVARETLLSN